MGTQESMNPEEMEQEKKSWFLGKLKFKKHIDDEYRYRENKKDDNLHDLEDEDKDEILQRQAGGRNHSTSNKTKRRKKDEGQGKKRNEIQEDEEYDVYIPKQLPKGKIK